MRSIRTRVRSHSHECSHGCSMPKRSWPSIHSQHSLPILHCSCAIEVQRNRLVGTSSQKSPSYSHTNWPVGRVVRKSHVLPSASSHAPPSLARATPPPPPNPVSLEPHREQAHRTSDLSYIMADTEQTQGQSYLDSARQLVSSAGATAQSAYDQAAQKASDVYQAAPAILPGSQNDKFSEDSGAVPNDGGDADDKGNTGAAAAASGRDERVEESRSKGRECHSFAQPETLRGHEERLTGKLTRATLARSFSPPFLPLSFGPCSLEQITAGDRHGIQCAHVSCVR